MRSPGPWPRPSPGGPMSSFPSEEIHPAFEEAAARTGIEDPCGRPAGRRRDPARTFACRPANSNRTGAWPGPSCESLGLDDRTIERGMACRRARRGSLQICAATFGAPPRPAVCVSLFAANEPESSAAALREVESFSPPGGRPIVGLLSLREDRGDRTLQWIRAAGEGFFRGFSLVFLLGPPARAALRKIRRRPAGRPGLFPRRRDRRPRT